MKRRGSFSGLRWVSIAFIFGAVILTVFQLVRYSRIRANFPSGTVIAGLNMGGLDRQTAAQRLLEVFSSSIELHYNQAVIQVKPSAVGFALDLEGMLTAADIQRVAQPFWTGFWDFLWNRQLPVAAIPLRSTLAEDRVKTFLQNEISARYDEPATAAVPIAGSVSFQPGNPGSTLDTDRAVQLIRAALESPTNRVVNLTYQSTGAARPSLQNLQILLQQTIKLDGFDGLVEIYVEDLQASQTIQFAYQSGTLLSTQPDIAFTGASTIKIPILVSVFKRVDDPTPDDVTNLLQAMIEKSDNTATDTVMEKYIDKDRGPLEVTADMQALGLNNTFLGGYFYNGAPLLQKFNTPANSRTDINTGPDVYDQTTASDMGMLMEDIYLCSQNGGGAFAAAFPGKISQSECQSMIRYLSKNDIAVLLQAGVPEGTQVAHKHGWVTETDGYLHTLGDVAIIYTPGGNYIMTIFMHHPTQLVWDPANMLVAQLSQAVYNYFNVNTPK